MISFNFIVKIRKKASEEQIQKKNQFHGRKIMVIYRLKVNLIKIVDEAQKKINF